MLLQHSFMGFLSLTLDMDMEDNSEHLEEIFGLCIRYICKCDTYTVFTKNVKKVIDFNDYDFTETYFRKKVRENGYLLTGIKFFALAYAKGKNCPTRAEKLYPQYDIYRCDAKAIKNIYERKGFKTGLLRDTTFDTSKESISPEALEEAVDTFLQMLPMVNKFAKAMTNKLRFIIKAENLQKDEFESEFMAQALRSYYYIIPTKKEGLELDNSLRASLTNHKTNIISSYTTQGRQRMVNAGKDHKGNDTFIMTLVSQSQMNGFSEEGEEIEFDGMLNESSQQKAENDFFIMAVDRLILKNLKSRRLPKRQQAELLAIFTGKPNENFERYLRDRNVLRSDTKTFSDFIDEKPREVYISEISNYMNISSSRVRKHLRAIGKQLALT